MLKPRGQTGHEAKLAPRPKFRPRSGPRNLWSQPRPWPLDPLALASSFWPLPRNLIVFSYGTWCP